jgi:hypothetical protein
MSCWQSQYDFADVWIICALVVHSTNIFVIERWWFSGEFLWDCLFDPLFCKKRHFQLISGPSVQVPNVFYILNLIYLFS